MVAVTAVAPMPGMPLVTVGCVVVLVPATPSVLSVCVSSPLVDGSLATFARTVPEQVGIVLNRASVLVMAMLTVAVGVFRCGGVDRVRC